ncbi:MAG: hypothetical protein SFT91_00890 [Rickettsiaceae bacterium]|nr:hypothetical protein [Rickettsiaceae bacterium]
MEDPRHYIAPTNVKKISLLDPKLSVRLVLYYPLKSNSVLSFAFDEREISKIIFTRPLSCEDNKITINLQGNTSGLKDQYEDIINSPGIANLPFIFEVKINDETSDYATCIGSSEDYLSIYLGNNVLK